MKIYAISLPFEGPVRFFVSEESAQANLASDELFSFGDYYVEEIYVNP